MMGECKDEESANWEITLVDLIGRLNGGDRQFAAMTETTSLTIKSATRN